MKPETDDSSTCMQEFLLYRTAIMQNSQMEVLDN
jgi:hypothetical protein